MIVRNRNAHGISGRDLEIGRSTSEDSAASVIVTGMAFQEAVSRASRGPCRFAGLRDAFASTGRKPPHSITSAPLLRDVDTYDTITPVPAKARLDFDSCERQSSSAPTRNTSLLPRGTPRFELIHASGASR
jgi:hypothetical protein